MTTRLLLNADSVAEARIQNAAIDRVAAALTGQYARALAGQMRAAAEAFGRGDSIAGAVMLNAGPLNNAYALTYRTASPIVGRRILDQAKSLHGARHVIAKSEGDGVPVLQLWNAQIARFIRAFGALRVQNVNDTTIAQLQRIISASYSAGKTVIEVQKEIRSAIPIISATRARAIARTETHAGAMLGGLTAAQVIEIDTLKRWNATEDGRTREDHADADGQTRALDGFFIIGSDKMQHPGDPSAEAGNVVNCRCVLDYPMG